MESHGFRTLKPFGKQAPESVACYKAATFVQQSDSASGKACRGRCRVDKCLQ